MYLVFSKHILISDILQPAWKRLGVLIPSKISESGEFENDIGLNNNQFGPLETLKEGDGIARVRCRQRDKS